jgi:predicted nucleic acid-binding protein
VIVADTNVIAYLYLPGEFTPLAERLLQRDAVWAAPILWRSEFRNVLALYLRKKLLQFDHAFAIQMEAEALLAEHEYEVDSYRVLQLADASHCVAYDCEFVVLAERLNVRLVTSDQKLITAFPKVCISLRDAVGA